MDNTFKERLDLIDSVRQKLKKSETVQKLFKDFGVDLSEIDLIPICFKNIDVSARTEHAIIYLNTALLEKPGQIDHYLTHEINHFLQQTTGNKPTQGSTEDDYLDNPYEIEGFQNQTKYISETRGDEAAEEYINKVLQHHHVPSKEKEERKNQLLELASQLSQIKQG